MMKTTTDARRGELQLTPRDIKMLMALETWGVLGIGQLVGLGLEGTLAEAELVERFFNKMDRDDYELGVARRIHALESAGYIHGHAFLRQPKAFTLSARGFAELSDEPRERQADVRYEVSEALIRHDLKLSAVGLVLTEIHRQPARREHPQIVWVKSGGRQHFSRYNAADLVIDTPEPKAIEVELTQKSRRRYEGIFDAYRRRPRTGAVLYLTGWPGGAAMILKNAREQRAPFIYACALDEFRRTAGRCVFRGAVESRTVVLAGADADPAGATR
ncbi:MAG: hypothetical protein HY403_08365 [Elusimicrobia bacterium]|nr:hypothetical protein [Elusimicrobiota bacterium]